MNTKGEWSVVVRSTPPGWRTPPRTKPGRYASSGRRARGPGSGPCRPWRRWPPFRPVARRLARARPPLRGRCAGHLRWRPGAGQCPSPLVRQQRGPSPAAAWPPAPPVGRRRCLSLRPPPPLAVWLPHGGSPGGGSPPGRRLGWWLLLRWWSAALRRGGSLPAPTGVPPLRRRPGGCGPRGPQGTGIQSVATLWGRQSRPRHTCEPAYGLSHLLTRRTACLPGRTA